MKYTKTAGHIRISLKEQRRHKQALAKKRERIAGLESLVQMWEDAGDSKYLRQLNIRLNNARNQLRAMRP